MRSPLAVAAPLVAALLPTAAYGQIFLGVRGGYGSPWGDASASAALKDSLAAQIPVTLDLGLRFGRSLMVGAYASYGIGLLPQTRADACAAIGRDCSAADFRIGAQANLVGSTPARAGPWAGLALGYEELRMRASGGGLPTDEGSLKGYDATLQAGFDLRVSPTVRLGPFASATVGQFLKITDGTETNITDQRLHGWFQIGLRVLFAP